MEAKTENVPCATTKAEEGLLPTSNFSFPTFDFQLPTSVVRLPTSVAMKGDGRPARLLRYAKMVLVPKTFFFSFCWVDYALEGSG